MKDETFRKFTWRNKIYSKNIEINCVSVEPLKILFPNKLVQKEEGHKYLLLWC